MAFTFYRSSLTNLFDTNDLVMNVHCHGCGKRMERTDDGWEDDFFFTEKFECPECFCFIEVGTRKKEKEKNKNDN